LLFSLSFAKLEGALFICLRCLKQPRCHCLLQTRTGILQAFFCPCFRSIVCQVDFEQGKRLLTLEKVDAVLTFFLRTKKRKKKKKKKILLFLFWSFRSTVTYLSFLETDVIPTTRLVEVLRLYIEQGHLSPPATAGAAPSLPQNHYDFLMKQAFPNSVRYLLKQQSFRGDEGLLRFKEIVSMFFQVIDLVLSWIDHDSVTMLSVLASIFDVQKNISRASSASAVLDDWVRTLDVNPRFVEPSKVATRVAWDQLNSRLVGALASHFGSHNGFDVLLKRLNGPPMPLEALKTIVKVLIFVVLSSNKCVNKQKTDSSTSSVAGWGRAADSRAAAAAKAGVRETAARFGDGGLAAGDEEGH
jgi:hypothetical protein